MNTNAASAIKSEVHQLMELQIQTFRQESHLTDVDLIDFRMRCERIEHFVGNSIKSHEKNGLEGRRVLLDLAWDPAYNLHHYCANVGG